MDVHPTPFPGSKTQAVQSKYKKATEASKIKAKEVPNQRQKRVFGTARNPNVPTKAVPEKPSTKPKLPISQKPHSTETTGDVVLIQETETLENSPEKSTISEPNAVSDSITNSPEKNTAIEPNAAPGSAKKSTGKNTDTVPTPHSKSTKKSPKETREIVTNSATDSRKKSPQGNRKIPKKKSVCFTENVAEVIQVGSARKSQGREIDLLRTPIRSPSLARARVSLTPYQSAEKCSNCRFDRLETASYWLGQIRLAESVGKHFVAVAFFRLAFDSKAEPLRNLKNELKHFLGRHNYLSAEAEWQDVSRKYGLLKDEETNVAVMVSSSEKVVEMDDGKLEEDYVHVQEAKTEHEDQLDEGSVQEPKAQVC